MTEPLRILVATVAHSPDDARIRHREMGAIRERGHQVTFMAPFSAFEVPTFDDVRCLDVSRSHGRHRLGPVWQAGRILRREAPRQDVIIGHDPELLPALFSVRRGPGRPVVVWDVHEDVPAQMRMMTWLPDRLKAPAAGLARGAQRLAEYRLRLTLAEHGYAPLFKRTHPVVPNSVRVPVELPPPQQELGRRIVYLGALTRARGVEEMLEIARRLPEGVHLELIGNAAPELDGRLRGLGDKHKVDYRGFVPNDEALRRLPGALAGLSLLHQHDNYAHSQPTKIMEYMAHGVPTITTPNRSSRDLIEQHGAGFVVDFGDTEAVLRHIQELAETPALYDKMSAAGRSAAKTNFDWRIDGARFVDQLEAWCDESPAH